MNNSSNTKQNENNAFHKTKIHWSSICICGFKNEPDQEKILEMLSEYFHTKRVDCTSCSIRTERGEETDFYLYVNFEPFFWTVELMDEILEKLRAIQKENDDVKLIHKRSMVDQIFLGGLHPLMNECDLIEMFSEFGHLINVEVKRRKNGKSRCFGFATFLDSRDSVFNLVEKRFIPAGDDHIEIKSIANKHSKSNSRNPSNNINQNNYGNNNNNRSNPNYRHNDHRDDNGFQNVGPNFRNNNNGMNQRNNNGMNQRGDNNQHQHHRDNRNNQNHRGGRNNMNHQNNNSSSQRGPQQDGQQNFNRPPPSHEQQNQQNSGQFRGGQPQMNPHAQMPYMHYPMGNQAAMMQMGQMPMMMMNQQQQQDGQQMPMMPYPMMQMPYPMMQMPVTVNGEDGQPQTVMMPYPMMNQGNYMNPVPPTEDAPGQPGAVPGQVPATVDPNAAMVNGSAAMQHGMNPYNMMNAQYHAQMQNMQMMHHQNPNGMNHLAAAAAAMNPTMLQNPENGAAIANAPNVQDMANQNINNVPPGAVSKNANHASIHGSNPYANPHNHSHYANAQLPKHGKTEITNSYEPSKEDVSPSFISGRPNMDQLVGSNEVQKNSNAIENNCLMPTNFGSMSSEKHSSSHVVNSNQEPNLSTIPQIPHDTSTPPLLYNLYHHQQSSNDVNNLHRPFNYYKPDLDSLNSVFSSSIL